MEARELRIGNWVYQGSKYGEQECSSYEIYQYSLYCGGSDSVSDYYKEWKPIPLTEEWLLKFGFSAKDYKKGYIGIDHKAGSMITDFVLTYPKVLGEHQDVFVWEHSKWKYNTFKYVHELQNLFYCLTGEELTLTP